MNFNINLYKNNIIISRCYQTYRRISVTPRVSLLFDILNASIQF